MNKLVPGFTYLVEHFDREGRLVDCEIVNNIVPVEGLNYLIASSLKGATRYTDWFIGLFEGNYTPVLGDSAATFPTAATECTAYDEALRQPLTLGAVAGGGVDNGSAVAEFTFGAPKTVYGGFITPTSAKGGTGGPLVSAVRFASPKQLDPDDVLRVTAGFVLSNAE